MKILLVDDYNTFRDSLAFLLLKIDPGIQLTCVRDFSEAATPFLPSLPDLILLDLSQPNLALPPITFFKKQCPHVPVVLLSRKEDRELIVEAITVGAKKFADKKTSYSAINVLGALLLRRGIHLPLEWLRAQGQEAATLGQTNIMTP